MKRQALQRVRPEEQPQHHNVYIVLCDPVSGRIVGANVADDNQKPGLERKGKGRA
jgi:hypothetical protein